MTCREPWEPVIDECSIHDGPACGIMVRVGGSVVMNKCKVSLSSVLCVSEFVLFMCGFF